jgi:hypothetical protein
MNDIAMFQASVADNTFTAVRECKMRRIPQVSLHPLLQYTKFEITDQADSILKPHNSDNQADNHCHTATL